MNLGEARSELGLRGFDYLTAPRRDLMLNRARNDFEDFWPWPWLRRTTTGPAPLAISDLKYVLSVRDADGRVFTAIDDRDIAGTLSTGSPSSWWIDDTSGEAVLRVAPEGEMTLTVRYTGEGSELVNQGDTPSIPARYHGIWLDLAVAYAYEDSDNFSAARELRTNALGRLQSLVERYETRNRSGAQQMAEVAWHGDA
jgi:hypothetical protein